MGASTVQFTPPGALDQIRCCVLEPCLPGTIAYTPDSCSGHCSTVGAAATAGATRRTTKSSNISGDVNMFMRTCSFLPACRAAFVGHIAAVDYQTHVKVYAVYNAVSDELPPATTCGGPDMHCKLFLCDPLDFGSLPLSATPAHDPCLSSPDTMQDFLQQACPGVPIWTRSEPGNLVVEVVRSVPLSSANPNIPSLEFTKRWVQLCMFATWLLPNVLVLQGLSPL
eukprot:gene10292-1861_t